MKLQIQKQNKLLYWIKIFLIYSPFIILLLFLKGKSGHGSDVLCWIEWSKYSFNEGLSNIYKSWTDYLPLYHYVLYAFGKIQGSVEDIAMNIHRLKVVTIFFEFGSTLILFKLLENKYRDTYKAIIFSLFYFMNIAVLFNSLIWNQIDGILTFFVFGSIISGYYKKVFPCLVLFLLAINTKLQAIIFLPIIGLLLFPLLFEKSTRKKIFLSIFVVILVQIAIIAPFIYSGDLHRLWNVVSGSVGKYPVVSMNAYNMWYFLLEGNPMEIQDSIKCLGLSYKTWGLLLFFISSFFALLHFVKPIIYTVLKKDRIEFPFKKVLISAAIIPLLFFFFNTQMHERYSHPALIFLAAYAMLYNRPVVFILGSIAYFLNMEDVLQFFQTNNYGTLVYTPWFIACIYLLVIVILFLDLYNVNIKLLKKKTDENRYIHSSSNI